MARVLELARRTARTARHAPDRLLHGWRRGRARARLRGMAPPGRALFVCLGNINRSPYAAAAFERAITRRNVARVVVGSAGFIGPGRGASPITRALARRRGLDLGAHESRTVDVEELVAADLVVVMDPRQRRELRGRFREAGAKVVVLGDLDPVPIVRRTIQDPYGHPEPVYEDVYDRIDRCIQELVDSIGGPGRDPASRP